MQIKTYIMKYIMQRIMKLYGLSAGMAVFAGLAAV